MGSRYEIMGPTSLLNVSFGVQPVFMNNAVINPQAMKAPMFGITMDAMNPPQLWILSLICISFRAEINYWLKRTTI
jgi:hypothetical protein